MIASNLLGIIIVSLVLLALLFIFLLKVHIKHKFSKHMNKVIDEGLFDEPKTIRLVETTQIEDMSDNVEQLIAQIDLQNFDHVGFYQIPELFDTQLIVYRNRQRNIYIIIYQNFLCSYFDVMSELKDGTHLIYTTLSSEADSNCSSYEKKYYLKDGAFIQDALQLLIKHAPNTRTIQECNFPNYFEKNYARKHCEIKSGK